MHRVLPPHTVPTLTTKRPAMRSVAALAAAAVALAVTSSATDIECGALKTPRECNRTPGCGFSDVCFRVAMGAEAYIAAYKRGEVVHCRPVKQERRGVRVIAVGPR